MTKVMLIEDDPTMLSLLNTLLEIEGFEVVHSQAFDAVVGEVQQLVPDIILLDVHLKDINGLDILDELRADENFKSTPVIMSSGMDFSSQCIEHGADDFIMKPYMPDELIKKIKRLEH